MTVGTERPTGDMGIMMLLNPHGKELSLVSCSGRRWKEQEWSERDKSGRTKQVENIKHGCESFRLQD